MNGVLKRWLSVRGEPLEFPKKPPALAGGASPLIHQLSYLSIRINLEKMLPALVRISEEMGLGDGAEDEVPLEVEIEVKQLETERLLRLARPDTF